MKDAFFFFFFFLSLCRRSNKCTLCPPRYLFQISGLIFFFSSFNFRSASFVEFVQLCLKKQPAERPTAEDLLQVSYWSVIKYVS